MWSFDKWVVIRKGVCAISGINALFPEPRDRQYLIVIEQNTRTLAKRASGENHKGEVSKFAVWYAEKLLATAATEGECDDCN